MIRALLLAALLAAAIGCFALDSHAQFGGMMWSSGGGGGAACTGTEWSASDKGADINRSGSPCKLTYDGGAPSAHEIVRSTSSKSGTSTSYYFEVTVNSASANIAVGLANGSENLGPSPDTYCGATTNSSGYDFGNGNTLYGGAVGGTLFTATTGDVIGFAIDMSGLTIPWGWLVNKNGGSFTGTGVPITGSSGEVIKICGTGYNNEGSITLNTCPSSPPAGYTKWDCT